MKANEFVSTTSMLVGWVAIGVGYPGAALAFGLWGLLSFVVKEPGDGVE